MKFSLLLTVLRKNALLLFILFCVSVGIYSNSLGNEFAVVDDLYGYIENQQIRNIPASFATLNIQNMVYSLNYHFFGINPLPLRVLAVLDHALAVMLLFLIINHLFGRKTGFSAALLFAVHPVTTEAVDWVSAHFYILMCNFQFAAILSHLAYRQTRNKRYIYLTVSILILYLILFQHPWVLAAPFVIVVIDFFILKKGFDTRFHKIFWFCLAPVLILYLLIRFPQTYQHRMKGETSANGKVLLNEQAIIPIIESYPYSIHNTLRLFIFPKDLTIYYDGRVITNLDRLLMFTSFLLYSAAFIYAYFTNKKIAGLLLLLVVCMAPVYSPVKVTWYITERYLYFCTGFFTTLLALLFLTIEKKYKIKYFTYYATAIVVTIFAVRTWHRNTDWKNPETLAFATMKTSPKSVRPYNDVAGYYVMHKRVADAKAYYVKALKMYPSSVAMNNLGYIYMLYGLDPDIRTLHQPYAATMKMGNDAMQKKEFRMALYYYNEIYTFNTNDIDLLNNITGALLELGSYDLAKKYLDKSYAINQKAPDTYFFYGYLAFKQGKITEAIASLQRVLQLQPNHAAARSNLQFLLEKYPSISPIPSPMNPVQK